ncbi:MAG: TMEM165/GDT1 family protein, partial [Schwartzia sp.]|nr:TMEM165/GDT1 family protein [Schwartzia sp. (in: firmicutes)]
MEGFIAAFTLVFCAEMGDKTQLIVMAFTARYSWRPVMAAVLAATLANHGLAVLLGVLLGGLLPETEMRIVGSIAFIV